jgi:hypothetical protein
LSFALIWGTIRIFVSQFRGAEPINDGDLGNVIAQEQIWGFGQVVAVVLLVLPVISFFGMLS